MNVYNLYVYIEQEKCLLVSSFLFDKLPGTLLADRMDVAHFVLEFHPIELVCRLQELGTKGGRDKLGVLCQPVNHGYTHTHTYSTYKENTVSQVLGSKFQ